MEDKFPCEDCPVKQACPDGCLCDEAREWSKRNNITIVDSCSNCSEEEG